MHRFYRCALVLIVLLTLPVVVTAQADLDALKTEVVATYAAIVHASYEDAYTATVEMRAAIAAFLETPTEATLDAAKAAWLAAREPYGQTEAYRFYGGPIDAEDGPEGLINAWPLDEAYVDYVEGAPDSGIIQNVEAYPTLDAALLESLNESGAEENVSVGYHAIEFLLWGQDLSADGPGSRPLTDYTSDAFAERRAAYLRIITDALVGHLAMLVDAWTPDRDDNYRAEFLMLPVDEALTRMLTGIGVLSKSELAGERMFTAYDNRDQEDEHSCFSDNTHRDIITNFVGIRNVYLGEYLRLNGTMVGGASLADILAEVDPELNTTILESFSSAETAINAIYVPFDQAILLDGERDVILEAVFSLMDLGDYFAQAATDLGLTIDTALPA